MRTPFCRRTTKFDMVTHMGRGLFLYWVSHAPNSRRLGPALPNFGSSFYIYVYALYRRTTKFDVVTRRERRKSWDQPRLPRLPSQQSECSPIFGVLLYLCPHKNPLTQNDQIRHGNRYAEGRIFSRISHAVAFAPGAALP